MVHLLEYLDDHNIKFHLPKGSRILDTGGYKIVPKNYLNMILRTINNYF